MNLNALDTSELQQVTARLRKILARTLPIENLKNWENLLAELAQDLNISHLQCAAILANSNKKLKAIKRKNEQASNVEQFVDKPKMVRYRLDVGRKHNVTIEDIKTTIIQESGVDRKQVGYIHIHAVYTLIDLPEGMPMDIFQHLQTVQLNNQPLLLKLIQAGRRAKGSFNKRSIRRVKLHNDESPSA